ncbi:MAG TPA: hypothetical protein VLJ21_03360 [Candidatus Binatia bacterium]|nr:hypothetical protein [Candidatus Binatia bacterium]
MPTDITVAPAMTRFYGPFNQRALLDAIRSFLQGEGFDDVQEPSYKHKVGGEGADIEIKMETDRKLNDYVKYFMNVEIRISDMKDVEVVHNGEKRKMQHGRVQVSVSGKAQLDYQKHFEGNKFLKALHDFYHKSIIKMRVEEYYDYIHSRILRLQRVVRETLGSEVNG